MVTEEEDEEEKEEEEKEERGRRRRRPRQPIRILEVASRENTSSCNNLDEFPFPLLRLCPLLTIASIVNHCK